MCRRSGYQLKINFTKKVSKQINFGWSDDGKILINLQLVFHFNNILLLKNQSPDLKNFPASRKVEILVLR